MLAKQVPYTIVKQVSFDFITKAAYSSLAATTAVALTKSTKFGVVMFSAFLASMMSCLASQPGDMLLSVVNAHKGKRRVRDFAREIYSEDGAAGFFTGLRARFLHVGIIVTSQLVVYDMFKRLCGLAATGLA